MSYPVYLPSIGNQLGEDLDDALHAARKKFPGSRHMLAALMEEVGELAQAILWTEEQGKNGTIAEVRAEAIHVCVCALRIITEGDADYPATVPGRLPSPPAEPGTTDPTKPCPRCGAPMTLAVTRTPSLPVNDIPIGSEEIESWWRCECGYQEEPEEATDV